MHIGHPFRFLLPLILFPLNDAEGVDPNIPKGYSVCNFFGILEGLCELCKWYFDEMTPVIRPRCGPWHCSRGSPIMAQCDIVVKSSISLD